MNKNIQSYSKIKNITFFIMVIGLLLPYSTIAQDMNKSILPTILSFNVNYETTDGVNIKKSNWIEFSWETEDANRVRLYREGVEIKSRSQLSNGEFGWPMSMAGGFKIQLKKPAIYELVAENETGKVSKKLAVNLKKTKIPPLVLQPKILDFRVLPQKIKSGDQVRFYWEVKNAKKVQLYDSYGEIKSRIELPGGELGWPQIINGSYIENLDKSETYILKVTNKLGGVERKVFKVTVEGKKID